MTLRCDEHGRALDAYIVCVHVMRKERPVALVVDPEVDADTRCGEALCVVCAARTPPLDQLRLICGPCVRTKILP